MKHDPFQEVVLTADESAAIDAMLANGTGRPTYLPVRTSTPITMEGLRALGFNGEHGEMYLSLKCGELEVIYLKSQYHWRVEFETQWIGVAPNLEAVAKLVDALKEINGGV